MRKILFAWIGVTDLNTAAANTSDLGPIAQAVVAESYNKVVLLNDHKKTFGIRYVKWLQNHFTGTCELVHVTLTSPTDFAGIYERAIETLKDVRQRFGIDCEFVFHLSPGTPAMAAVWIIISKTRFPATLIESSKAHGVRIASVPFDISADYLPDLLRKPDDQLIRLSHLRARRITGTLCSPPLSRGTFQKKKRISCAVFCSPTFWRQLSRCMSRHDTRKRWRVESSIFRWRLHAFTPNLYLMLTFVYNATVIVY